MDESFIQFLENASFLMNRKFSTHIKCDQIGEKLSFVADLVHKLVTNILNLHILWGGRLFVFLFNQELEGFLIFFLTNKVVFNSVNV